MKKLIFFVIILLLIFVFLYYNTSIFGNNIIIKDENKVANACLDSFYNYEAEIEVTVKSNKTTNVYEMKQKVDGGYSYFEVTSTGKINGLKVEFQDNTLKFTNTELNLDKIYNNYDGILKNSLFLNNFSDEYKGKNSTTYKENDKFVFETDSGKKKLYVSAQTLKPEKLEIKDDTKNTDICIVYKRIETL